MKSLGIQLTIIAVASIVSIQALDNGLGLTPAMGWSTWNSYGCNINLDIIKKNTDIIVQLGLDTIGYKYVNIDDCWALPDRNKDGRIQHDESKFPGGMTPVGDYIHSKGLKFGLYSSAGTLTCQKKAGSLGHEKEDASDFSMVGTDYLKYDNCNNGNVPAITRYTAMADALNATGRPIYYSVCNWGEDNVWQWASKISNSWRTTGDINNNFQSMKYNFYQNNLHPEVAGKGAWNDPDMLQIGNGNLTYAESRSHFALWCFVKAPLILGNDLTNIAPEVLNIISNKNLIAINQDSNTVQGTCVMNCQTDLQVYKTYNIDNGPYFGLLIMNWNDEEFKSILLDFVVLGVAGDAYFNCQVTDLWSGVVIGNYKRTYLVTDVAPHDNIALKIKCLPWGQTFEEVKPSHHTHSLHECALNERQILTQKLRRLSLIDDQLKNNEDKTALDIENTIKDEQFRDQIEKQKQITESKLRKKRIQEEKALIQDLQRKEEEELIEKERQEAKNQQKKGTHNPAAEAQRFRMFALLAFFLFLLAAYFILDFIAKSKEKTGPGSMRRERREGL